MKRVLKGVAGGGRFVAGGPTPKLHLCSFDKNKIPRVLGEMSCTNDHMHGKENHITKKISRVGLNKWFSRKGDMPEGDVLCPL